jgi:hypothetical protein
MTTLFCFHFHAEEELLGFRSCQSISDPQTQHTGYRSKGVIQISFLCGQGLKCLPFMERAVHLRNLMRCTVTFSMVPSSNLGFGPHDE